MFVVFLHLDIARALQFSGSATSSRFHSCRLAFILLSRMIIAKTHTLHFSNTDCHRRTMSYNNSDQMKECLGQTSKGGNTVDRSSRGASRNQDSRDPAAKEATSQTASCEARGKTDKTMPTSSEKKGEGGGEKTGTSVENAEKGAKKAIYDEHRDKMGQNTSSDTASETSRGSNQPSRSEPMDTSDSSSSVTRPKPVIVLGPTFPIKNLKTMELFSSELNSQIPMKGHTVLIDTKYFRSGVIVPHEGKHVWDSYHVKLPHMYQLNQKSRGSSSRWDAICQALHRLTKGSFSIGDIQAAIMSYNSSNRDKWTFDAFYYYGQRLHAMDNNLDMVIPKMAKLALELPGLIKRPIPLLRQQQPHAITMSQQQISCLLANAFFCTFPHRNDTSPGSEYANYPTINFSSLFDSRRDALKATLQAEKLRAIFHYFYTVTNESPQDSASSASKPDGLVTFERICIPPSLLPDWNNRKEPLKNLHISSEGSIERDGAGMLQVDFASKYIGGGVLKSGLVQEEILFLMSPELIVARLFTEKLADNECLKITGPQMYNITSGYSKGFSWVGPYTDELRRDAWKRRYRQIVAIDALDFKNPREQYTKENIKRELNKAFVGFQGTPKTAIATGNWGCGAFRGDPKLKALIQLMAAAVADRDMAYFTFANEHLAYEVQRMHDILTQNRVTVDKLYKLLKDYSGHYDRERHSPKDLYRFIREKIGHMDSSL